MYTKDGVDVTIDDDEEAMEEDEVSDLDDDDDDIVTLRLRSRTHDRRFRDGVAHKLVLRSTCIHGDAETSHSD